MFEVKFKASAKKHFDKLPVDIRQRLITKLEFFLSQVDPLVYAEILTNPRLGTYRFRVGDYRIIFDLTDGNIIMIVGVGHRKDIYR